MDNTERRKMKKKSLIFVISLFFLLVISRSVISSEWTLKLVFGESQTEFTLDELKDLPVREAERRGAIYKGVLLRDLLVKAGLDIGKIEYIEAFSSDGYKVQYERKLAKNYEVEDKIRLTESSDIILTYEKDGAPLPEKEGKIRVIIPGGRSSMQIKFLEKIFIKLGEWKLTLVTGDKEREYSLAELKKMPEREIEFNSKVYRGVSLKTFLEKKGVNFSKIKSVEVVASDNYKVNYELETVLEDKIILAYKVDGILFPEKMGKVRCILPGKGKKMQVKRLERIIIK